MVPNFVDFGCCKGRASINSLSERRSNSSLIWFGSPSRSAESHFNPIAYNYNYSILIVDGWNPGTTCVSNPMNSGDEVWSSTGLAGFQPVVRSDLSDRMYTDAAQALKSRPTSTSATAQSRCRSKQWEKQLRCFHQTIVICGWLWRLLVMLHKLHRAALECFGHVARFSKIPRSLQKNGLLYLHLDSS